MITFLNFIFLSSNYFFIDKVSAFYNISKEEPVQTVKYDDEIIADLTVNGNYVYCIGESKTEIYTVTGDKKSEIPYKDRSILSYVVKDSGIVISFKEGTLSDKRYSIRIYKENGNWGLKLL